MCLGQFLVWLNSGLRNSNQWTRPRLFFGMCSTAAGSRWKGEATLSCHCARAEVISCHIVGFTSNFFTCYWTYFPFTSQFILFLYLFNAWKDVSWPPIYLISIFFRSNFPPLNAFNKWQIIFPKVWKDPLQSFEILSDFSSIPVILLSTISSFCPECQWTHPPEILLSQWQSGQKAQVGLLVLQICSETPTNTFLF